MDKPEMLKKLGLSPEEHKDLVSRFSKFYNPLTEPQKAVIRRSMPTADQAAKSFGPEVTAEHVQSFFCADVQGAVMLAIAHG